MPSHNLETKQALNQGWGYKIEAESSSKTVLPWTNSCRLWLSAKLSLAEDAEGPACGCPEQFFTTGPDFPKGRLEDSSWWRWPEWLAGYHSQYCAVQTGSPQRSKTWLPGSVGVGEGAGGRRNTSSFCVHHHHSSSEERMSIWKFLSGLHFLGHLIFYCWARTTKRSNFLFLSPYSLLLGNLGLNCLRGTFKFYKLASLKMLKRLWKHSHFILSFIKSSIKKDPKLPWEAKLA